MAMWARSIVVRGSVHVTSAPSRLRANHSSFDQPMRHQCWVLQARPNSRQPETSIVSRLVGVTVAEALALRSGMHTLPFQVPSSAGWKFWNSWRPIRSWPLPLFASARALGIAQTTVPHIADPHRAVRRWTVMLVMRQVPSHDVGVLPAVGAAGGGAAATSNAAARGIQERIAIIR